MDSRIGDKGLQERKLAKREVHGLLHRSDEVRPGVPATHERLDFHIGLEKDLIGDNLRVTRAGRTRGLADDIC